MKKTESINLGGNIFIFDEDAYKILSEYLSKVRKHIGGDVDFDEVMNDIENSMAEKLKEKVSENKQNIDAKDVEELISIMGTVEDFEKSFGGEKDEENRKEKIATTAKNLYRNPDNKIIAGVCSGISTYFDKDPFIVRAIFLLLFFFGNGIALPIYLAMWIITPSAKTTAQKLEMNGSPLTIDSIKKNRTSRPVDESENRKKAKKFFKKLWTVLVYFFGFILATASLFWIFTATTGIGLAWTYSHSYTYFSDIPIESIKSAFPFSLFILISFFVLIIPAFLTLTAGIAVMFKRKVINSTVVLVSIALWLSCVFVNTYIFTSNFLQIRDVLTQSERIVTETEDISLDEFHTISIEGNKIRASIVQGNNYSMSITGRNIDLENVDYEIIDGELLISTGERKIEKDCWNCYQGNVEVVITAPNFKNIRIKDSKLIIEDGTYESINIETEYSVLDINIKSEILDIQSKDSTCKIAGEINSIKSIVSYTDLESEAQTENFTTEAANYSNIRLFGKNGTIVAKLEENSVLSALGSETETATIELDKESWAGINANKEISGSIKNEGGLCYIGEPTLKNLEAQNTTILRRAIKIPYYEYSKIRRSSTDFDDKYFYDGNNYYEIINEGNQEYNEQTYLMQRAFSR